MLKEQNKRARKPQTHRSDRSSGAKATEPIAIRSMALPSMFWGPSYAIGSDWLYHVPFLFWMVEAQRPQLVVDVADEGADHYFAICQAVKCLGLGTKCFSINRWAHPSCDEFAYEEAAAHNDEQYLGFSKVVRGNPDEHVASYRDASVDLLTVSAATPEFTVPLLKAWLPKLSPRAIILIHCSNMIHADDEAFRDLIGGNPCLEFGHDRGLAVLAIGSEHCDDLRRVIGGAAGEACHIIKDVFAHLGRACAASPELRDGQRTVRRLTQKLQDQEERANASEGALKKTKTTLTERVEGLDKLKKRIADLVEEHAVERGRLSARTMLLEEVKSELRSALNQRSKECEALAVSVAKANQDIEKLQAANRELSAKLEIAHEMISTRDQRINELTTDQILQVQRLETIARECSERHRERDETNQLKSALHEARWKIDHLDQELAKRNVELERAQDLLQGAQSSATVAIRHSAQLRAELDGAKREIAELAAKMSDAHAEAVNLNRDLVGIGADGLKASVVPGAFGRALWSPEGLYRCTVSELKEVRAKVAGLWLALQASRRDVGRLSRDLSIHQYEACRSRAIAAGSCAAVLATEEHARQIQFELERERQSMCRTRAEDELLSMIVWGHHVVAEERAHRIAALSLDLQRARQTLGTCDGETLSLCEAAVRLTQELNATRAEGSKQDELINAMQQDLMIAAGDNRSIDDKSRLIRQQLASHVGESKALRSRLAEQDQAIERQRGEVAALTRIVKEKDVELAKANQALRISEQSSKDRAAELARVSDAAIASKQEAIEVRSGLKSIRSELEQSRQTHELERDRLLTELHAANRRVEECFEEITKLTVALGAERASLHHRREDTCSVEVARRQKTLKRVIRLPGRMRSKQKRRLARNVSLIRQSGLFDADWYLNQYGDVTGSVDDAAAHYLLTGESQGRSASSNFNGQDYLRANPDVAESKVGPLLHYIRFGRSEGRCLR